MPLRGKIPFALLASLFALEFAFAQSASPVVVPPKTPVSIGEDSKPAVETLRMIAKEVEECPKALDFENRWGKKEDEIERYYEEPPANVVWDVAAGNSVRAPYLGFVEFAVDVDHWVPDSARRRFMNSAASIAYAEIMMGRHYRYEYDLGPDGLRLARVLARNTGTGEWVEPNRSVIENHCWDAAARDTQIKAKVLPDKRGQDEPPVSISNDNKPAVAVSAHDGDEMLKDCKAYLNMMSLRDRPANDPGFRHVDELELTTGTYCLGYVMGVVEEQFVWGVANPPSPTDPNPGLRHFCVPNAVTSEQEVRVIVKWLEDHPEQLHEPALLVVHRALGGAFSCAQPGH